MRDHFRVAAVLPLVLALCACASGGTAEPPATPSAWTAEIDQLLAGELTDFEREVLADYAVSDQEYRQAQSLFFECMESRGFKTRFVDKEYLTESTSGDKSAEVTQAAQLECGEATISKVESTYYGMRENPRNLSFGEAVRECFDAQGVKDGAELEAAEFDAFISDPQFRPSGPAAEMCLTDPFRVS